MPKPTRFPIGNANPLYPLWFLTSFSPCWKIPPFKMDAPYDSFIVGVPVRIFLFGCACGAGGADRRIVNDWTSLSCGGKQLSDNVISYIEMCRREETNLQAGMNFGLGGNHSVVLMSLRANAPYRDRLEDGATTLIYEGHDQQKGPTCPNPMTSREYLYHILC